MYDSDTPQPFEPGYLEWIARFDNQRQRDRMAFWEDWYKETEKDMHIKSPEQAKYQPREKPWDD